MDGCVAALLFGIRSKPRQMYLDTIAFSIDIVVCEVAGTETIVIIITIPDTIRTLFMISFLSSEM
jgi:hypothetical protein